MTKESEQVLEEQLLELLQKLGYHFVNLNNEAALIANFKTQLEKHNHCTFSETEFKRVMNQITKGTVFEKAKTLREKQHLVRDNGENLYFEFINTEFWCQNQYQVAQQVRQEGNRYDVTLLINGLPLIQIELKRKGVELKEAFNQINRYQRQSFGSNAALYQYVQLFVISNGVNTKYYANNRNQSFKQTFYWTDIANKRLTNLLDDFTPSFLEPCHLSKMLCRYIVLNETNKILMVLRPYQYFAVEALLEQVQTTTKNGYIWHTTGSGKTLTSFKASQIMMQLPQVHKVVFVVDRKDLDYQTSKEFNSFSKDCVGKTNSTQGLVQQFFDSTPLIVTTIQKLDNAIKNSKYDPVLTDLKDKRMVFIFDECHRSQFGDTHDRIKKYFKNIQLFGFTGTPILAANATQNKYGKRTTTELFGKCLHKYVITDAIKDENVLKFSVEYVGKYQQKPDRATNLDIEVEDIDTKELMEDKRRLEKIADYIIAQHPKKTHSRTYTGMFCINNVPTLIKYYDILKRKQKEGLHALNIATIFSYKANEADPNANGYNVADIEDDISIVAENESDYTINATYKDKLETYIEDYNQFFNTKFSTRDSESYYNYYNDISRNVRNRKIDLLLVVDMFLTGFDSPSLNTLYVDKNLKHHGLIQAYSRTNRILNEEKSQGNIVVFRNLKNQTDEAITLFGNKEAIDIIIMQPYEDYTFQFDKVFEALLKITPTIKSVDDLVSENDELAFVKTFRDLMRLKNVLSVHSDFKADDIKMASDVFDSYKSKYLDLYEKVKHHAKKEKVSILGDVDFELELIRRDEINVAYIIQLLIKLKSKTTQEMHKSKQEIFNLLSSETTLRSKRVLIEMFIQKNLPLISDIDEIQTEFEAFWQQEKQKAFLNIVTEEELSAPKTEKLIHNYLFTERKPLTKELFELLEGKVISFFERKKWCDHILKRIMDFIETFINGMSQ
jgi:type I restriction enzyme, R subunit